METDKLKINTLIFFFNAMKDLHKGIDCALEQLDDNNLEDQQKFHLMIELLGNFGLNQQLFIDQVCNPPKPETSKKEIVGPIQKFDYQSFPEEKFESLRNFAHFVDFYFYISRFDYFTNRLFCS